MSIPDDPSFELRQTLQAKAEELEAAAHKIGLHAQDLSLGSTVNPVTGQPGPLVIMAAFALGDLAFSDRVQDPEMDDTKTEVAKMESDMVEDQIQQIRERYEGTGDDTTGNDT